MRLGIVGFATNSGLGRQFFDALKHLPVQSAFVLTNPAKRTRFDLLDQSGTDYVLSRHRDAGHFKLWLAHRQIDTVLTWEVPGNWAFVHIMKDRQVRWFHHVNWEWIDIRKLGELRYATLIAPNQRCITELHELGLKNYICLPTPIDLEFFPFRPRVRAQDFLTINGYGGCGGRRQLDQIIRAWQILGDDAPHLIIRTQIILQKRHKMVDVRVNDLDDPRDLYALGDVLLQPSAFEGVGLTLLEAQACGIPAVTTDAPPMNEICAGWRLPCRAVKFPFWCRDIIAHRVRAETIATAIRVIAGTDISEASRRAHRYIKEHYSWSKLQRHWLDALGD